MPAPLFLCKKESLPPMKGEGILRCFLSIGIVKLFKKMLDPITLFNRFVEFK